MSEKVYSMSFAKLYPLYINKIEKKGRTKDELDAVITWLTGYTKQNLEQLIEQDRNVQDFVEKAPQLNPNRSLIKGVVCGVRVEEVVEDLMREVRYLDKLVDELAKGKKLENILRK